MLLWRPTWTIKALMRLGWYSDAVAEFLVLRVGVWDAVGDGDWLRWQLFPWRNNMKRLLAEEKARIASTL